MSRFLALIFVSATLMAFGQQGRRTTTDKNTVFLSWGYNRSWYSNSDISFKGDSYDLTLANASASDRPEEFSFASYFSPEQILVPQFNFRAGFYVTKNWSVTLAFDHFKYVLDHGNTVNIYGNVDEGYDNVTFLSGDYSGEQIVTDSANFHYENANGMNYIRLAIDRSIPIIRATRRRKFGVTALVGGGGGPIVSGNQFRFAGEENQPTRSLSGFGLSAHTGLRFEFLHHLFLQPSIGAGYINQLKVITRPRELFGHASQQFGYFEYNVQLGWLFHIKGKEDCDCPTW